MSKQVISELDQLEEKIFIEHELESRSGKSFLEVLEFIECTGFLTLNRKVNDYPCLEKLSMREVFKIILEVHKEYLSNPEPLIHFKLIASYGKTVLDMVSYLKDHLREKDFENKIVRYNVLLFMFSLTFCSEEKKPIQIPNKKFTFRMKVSKEMNEEMFDNFQKTLSENIEDTIIVLESRYEDPYEHYIKIKKRLAECIESILANTKKQLDEIYFEEEITKL
ncbi:hypothetical protein [Flammeovirga sp. SJP92]|uniref:hypothetical protein n=1 Tax=Flammeovirga sp. SJP92 TaxID=1775430 RepID=UPI0007871E5D|nr:hypothetical protein [Flammeovirga sp. SJP92]KXX66883.1 hypothetical protein AVL50_30605 [Flammeovirga sp. SJP92]